MTTGKVAIIGGGKVGMTSAYALLLRGIARELVFYDRDVEKMKGEQIDFQDSLAFLGSTTISVAQSTDDIQNCDVIIYSTGVPQLPGQSRLDLVKKNVEILDSLLPLVVKNSPNAIIIFVANPVDILTYRAQQLLKLPKGRIFGTGTSLDTARFRFHLSESLGVSPKNIHAYILGEHGDSSFPVTSSINVGGQPIMTIAEMSQEKLQDAYLKTKNAAGTIITAKGATYYAIGVVVSQLVSAVIRDKRRIFPLSVPLNSAYGYENVALSVPCVVGKNGIERVIEIPLSEEEKKKMEISVNILKSFI